LKIENCKLQIEEGDSRRAYMTVWTILAAVLIGLGAGYAFAQTTPANPDHPVANDRAHSAQSAANSDQPPSATPTAVVQHSGGSLLRASLVAEADPARAKLASVSYFAVPEPEARTIKKHDLVTIIVREESAFSSEGTTDLKKSADLDAKIEQFIKLNLKELTLENAFGSTSPEIKMNASRNFKGEATVDRTDSLIFRITAEVIDVKPNGTLIMQAKQRIKTDDEEQTFTFSGTGRVEDVTADNTILSTQLFDKDLTKSHTGAVRDTTKRGWLTKLLDMANPF
jgi:flagellar L-ring protein precursor FlgH